MKKINLVVLLLIVITLVLQGINIYLSNKIAANSINVSKMQENIDALNEKNQILEAKILDSTSLDHIASRAAQLGFASDNKNYISLYSPLEVAITR
jgi:cell division protein FtsL